MHLQLNKLLGAHKALLSHYSSLIRQCLVVGSVHNAKTIHAQLLKLGLDSNTFLGNHCLQLYTLFGPVHDVLKAFDGIKDKNIISWNICLKGMFRFGDVDAPRHLFDVMPERDIVSWNTMISGYVSSGFAKSAMGISLEMQNAGFRPSCHRSGFRVLALNQFFLMRTTEHSPDQFTISMVISICCCLQELELVQLFEDTNQLDPVLCNVMISSFAWHGHWRDSMWLFVYTLRENLGPIDTTLSSVLSSVSVFTPVELGSQIHNLVLKLGFEFDVIVASSLVDMYAKVGSIDDAMKVFIDMPFRDLISWNTMIMGLVDNGKYFEALHTFNKLVMEGVLPDRITLAGVLLACSYAGFVEEGLGIFSTMTYEHGVVPSNEHYSCVVNLLSRAGKFEEAVNIIKTTPYQPTSTFWTSLLGVCAIHGDLKIIEKVAEWVMKLEPQSSLPYSVLAQAYAIRCQWESMVRVKNTWENIAAQKVKACSWIVTKDCAYAFEDDQLQLLLRKNFISVLELIIWEIEYGIDYEQYLEIIH
ncbi:hypothetical protein IC582_004734 [Cucumis melo]